MQEFLVSGKIAAPALPSTILHRETLCRVLGEAITPVSSSQRPPYKLVLLCAAAGYGKTLLLADTVRHTSLPCCWYSLDSSDTHPALFLKILFASIRRCFPTFGSHLDPLFSEIDEQTEPERQLLLDALLNALKAEISEPFLLAFCNYQAVNDSLTINQLMNHLLAHLPPQVLLIIESRTIPDIELASLIARRQMFGLGTQKLHFTAQEVFDLAHLQGTTTMTLQEAEENVQTFDGWIAGMLLGSSLGYSHLLSQPNSGSDTSTTFAIGHDHQLLSAYVTNEIFGHEKASYEFLKETSILARPTAARCNALLERTDAEQRLNYAERQGLFLTRAEEQSNQTPVYLCHPILRKLFQEELRNSAPDRYLALNSRAARIFLNELAYEHALTHALQAQEYQLAADILPEIANAHIARKGTKAMKDWLNLFPEEFLSKDPRLLLIWADIYEVSGEKQRLFSLLDKVEALLQKESKDDSSALSLAWAELFILRAKLLFSQNEFHMAQQLCEEALALLPADQRLLRIKALQCLGIGLMLGTQENHQSIVHLQSALQLSNPQHEQAQTAVLHRQLGTAYVWQGNYILAEHHQKRALSIWEQMENPRGIVYSLITLGHLKRHQGFTQEAEEMFLKALDLTRTPHQFRSGEAFALAGLGELACDQRQYSQALTYLEDSLDIAHELQDTYLLHCDLCYLATIHAFMDDIHTAQFFLNQVTLKEQEQSSYERLLYDLAQGAIFLAQHTYEQAKKTLEQAVLLAQQANLQLLYIRALLNLAVCSLRQGKRRLAFRIGKQVREINKRSDHDQAIQVEIGHYPELQDLLDQASRKSTARKKTYEVETPSSEENTLFQSEQRPPRLRILGFGEPQVFSNGIPITQWRMARTMQLYFFLLENRRPLRKEQIMVALWPDVESEKVDQIFRSSMYYLRKAIGEEYLEYASGFYHLDLTRLRKDQVWYDVELFDTCYRQAKKSLEQEDGEAAAAAFTQMIDLYKGDYLQPFYNDWCILRRDQLREAYIDARHQMALICWRREDFEASLQHWQYLLALDACFEKAHYGIMRYYLHHGKREMALRQYQRCSRMLQEELHATPGPSLQKLYQRILGESSP